MKIIGGLFSSMLLVAMLAPWGGSLFGADFIRGDANGDGVVTLADAHLITKMLYQHGPSPDCMNAADANDDGVVDLNDVSSIASYVLTGQSQPPSPFPSMGPDPTPNGSGGSLVDCQSYGGGTPLVDPEALLTVEDSILPGWAFNHAVITLNLSNSTPVAGYLADIRVGGSLLIGAELQAKPLNGASTDGWATVRMLSADVVRVSVLNSVSEDNPILPGQDLPVVELTVCLKYGVTVGEYPITIDRAELIDSDSSRAIHPAVAAGKLKVLNEVVQTGTECAPRPPSAVNSVFKLGQAKGKPGSQVTVPFIMRSAAEITGYSFSVDFDEEVLEATSLEFVWQRPDGQNYFFHLLEFNNQNQTPGNAGIDEGFAIGATTIDRDGVVLMPPNTDNVAVLLHFNIKPNATASSTRLRFIKGAKGKTTTPVGNVIGIRLDGEFSTAVPEESNSFILVEGKVTVLPDIAVFVRGDSNADGTLDISDPIGVLSFLYQGGAKPECLDAADFNDDGLVDISDPIASLTFLYTSGEAPPSPYPGAGPDPTEDLIGCFD